MMRSRVTSALACAGERTSRTSASPNRARVIMCRSSCSRLAQQRIHNPASANVFAVGAAVFEHVLVGTAGLFERVAEDREIGEGALQVDRAGQLPDVRMA